VLVLGSPPMRMSWTALVVSAGHFSCFYDASFPFSNGVGDGMGKGECRHSHFPGPTVVRPVSSTVLVPL
jgi:hypothetical protein